MSGPSKTLMEKLYGKQYQVDTADIAPVLHQYAEPLPDLDTPAFAALFDRYADARVILLGEASHGSSEFYRARAAITRRLIEEKGFTAVAVEADWPDAASVDRHVRLREALAPAVGPPFQRGHPDGQSRQTAQGLLHFNMGFHFDRWIAQHHAPRRGIGENLGRPAADHIIADEDVVIDRLRRYQKTSENDLEAWPDPTEISASLPHVFKFDERLLPGVFAPWIKDIAERMQCPIEYLAVGALVGAGAPSGAPPLRDSP